MESPAVPDGASVPSLPPEVATKPRWSFAHRVLFRFVFVYFVIYSLPFPFSAVPWQWLPERVGKAAGERIFTPWAQLVDWTVKQKVGPWLVARPITIGENGSGDTTWNYVAVASFAAAALVLTLLWTAIDWWSKDYRRLHDWWRTWIRCVLGLALIGYGCSKAIPVQMPPPDLGRLAEPIGATSPMGLLWTFLGASSGYQILSGCAELLGGWLLVTRRTTTLGALVAAGVMFNVAALNFCYDTPVKLYSTHLFLMAFLLIVGDAPRLLDVFIFHRAVAANDFRRLFPWRRVNIAAALLGVALFGCHTWLGLRGSYRYFHERVTAPRPPLYGVWVTKTFELDGAPVVGDENEVWHRAIAGSPYIFVVDAVGAPFTRYFSEYDEKSKSLNLRKGNDPNWKAHFTYDKPSDGLLTLQGKMGGHDLYVEMRRLNEPDYLLMTRGFHWINEYPDNE